MVFWHSCTVKTTVDNNAEAWAVLQPTAVNSAHKFWPQHVPARITEPGSIPLLCHSTVVLASHVGLGNVAEADVACLLQAYEEPSRSCRVPEDSEDGDVSSSWLPWEEEKGLFQTTRARAHGGYRD